MKHGLFPCQIRRPLQSISLFVNGLIVLILLNILMFSLYIYNSTVMTIQKRKYLRVIGAMQIYKFTFLR